jgi:hypothetical protein
MGTRWVLVLGALLLAGCHDDRDVTPPAAPRGVYTVTGDQEVIIHWLANTEGDLVGYRVYEAPCATGGGCPYDPVGATTGTSFQVTGLANGVTRYFAVAAYDRAGNESRLSREILFDTPRPEGSNGILNNYLDTATGSGYDFSTFSTAPWDDPATDMFYGDNGTVREMFVPDFQTDIQDAGFASSLDAVDFAPSGGWSPSGSVELIVGHCYVVWTRDDHYAKFRVTDIRPSANGVPGRVTFDWAYQVDPGNRELRAVKAKNGTAGAPRTPQWAG